MRRGVQRMGMWQAYAKRYLILCKPFAWPWAYYILTLKTKNIRTPRTSILTAGLPAMSYM
jgi:hypothetical protein